MTTSDWKNDYREYIRKEGKMDVRRVIKDF